MRILMTNYEFPPLGGGAGKMTEGLARRLVELGDDVEVLTMGTRELPVREETAGVSIIRIPTKRHDPAACTVPEAAAYLVRALPKIRRMTRERRYELIHSHFIFPDGLLAMNVADRLGVPYIVTAHGTDVPGHNPHRARLLHAVLRPVWRRVTSRAAAIACPSAALADKVRQANPLANVIVIPNAFDADRFEPNRMRQPRILAVARMIKLKGLQYLIEALRVLGEPRDVVFVGDGPYATELRELARTLGVGVEFTGWLEGNSHRLRTLYETSEMLVFPSEAENCPLVLLEAMAAGLPIITTTDAGCRDVVGDSAIVVPPRDPTALAGAISQLAADADLRRRLGGAARLRVVERYSWGTLLESYKNLYTQYAH